jgi:hypothetical protein
LNHGAIEHPPNADQFEVSVFGRGMGECIMCHLGEGRWLMVDSFRDADGIPIANSYLDDLEGGHQVVAVVATHWDDDHTHGMAEVIRTHDPAEVWMPIVLNKREVFRFAVEHVEAMEGRGPSGLRDFVEVLGVTSGRRTRRWGMLDRSVATGTAAEARLLAPTDEMVDAGIAALGVHLDPGFGEVSEIDSNRMSIVLWVSNGARAALLGADLENGEDGWPAVLRKGSPTGARASLIKIPHHGSTDADEARIWTELLTDSPVNTVTRFTKKRDPLPLATDVQRLTERAGALHIAGAVPERLRPEQDAFDLHLEVAAVGGLRPAYGPIGVIRARSTAEPDGWSIHSFGEVETALP